MIIEVFQDTICPWCRIGKKHLQDAIKQWDGEPITIRYRAYQLDANAPKQSRPFRETMAATKGGPEVVEQMIQHVTQAGRASGVIFNFDRVKHMPNTADSHALIKLASEEKNGDMVEAIYQEYFEEGKDIGDLEVLLQIAEQQGLNSDEVKASILSGEKQDDVEEDQDIAAELGITGVPFFVIDGKLGLSGAHPVETFLKAFRKVTTEE